MTKVAVIGKGNSGLIEAVKIAKNKIDLEVIDPSCLDGFTLPKPPELETLEITNPYKDYVGFGIPEYKPSKNQLKKCTKGLHLYNQKKECVRCGKKLNL